MSERRNELGIAGLAFLLSELYPPFKISDDLWVLFSI